jgi:hypothetical protein
VDLKQVEAFDDRGEPIPPLPAPNLQMARTLSMVPDRRQCFLLFQPPSPKATKIAELRGELVLYADLTPLRFEFKNLREARNVKRSEGGVEVTLKEVQVRPKEWIAKLTCKAPLPPPGMSTVPSMPFLSPVYRVLMRDSRGKVYYFRGYSSRGTREEEHRFWEQEFRFSSPGEGVEPEALIYEVVLRAHPTLRIPFRFTDIPLPTGREE